MTRLPAAFHAIAERIGLELAQPFAIEQAHPAGGGCINDTWVIAGAGERFFVKLNASDRLDMFDAERDALEELAHSDGPRVPRPIACGADAEHAWLVLEYVELGGRADWKALGRRLAAQHRCTAPAFGWHRDNTIGSTPQLNPNTPNWPDFFRDARLGFQLRLAQANGHRAVIERGARLLQSLEVFFAGYRPHPSLLHGDLWSGNAGFCSSGEPVIFDPALYFGDREADLAMTELFGGFGTGFYAAYCEAWPLDPGYPVRKRLYNLYHLLNHLNLFGLGYLDRCAAEIEWLIAQT
jgi:fructosamine-3-kinase